MISILRGANPMSARSQGSPAKSSRSDPGPLEIQRFHEKRPRWG